MNDVRLVGESSENVRVLQKARLRNEEVNACMESLISL